jgi:hypothetical protein
MEICRTLGRAFLRSLLHVVVPPSLMAVDEKGDDDIDGGREARDLSRTDWHCSTARIPASPMTSVLCWSPFSSCSRFAHWLPRIASFCARRKPLLDTTIVWSSAKHPRPIPRSLELGAYPPVQPVQHGPRAAEKQTPRASSKTEEQVNLRASCFPGNAPSHEVLAVIQNRVIQILADARPCPLKGFFPRVRPRLVLPDAVGMVCQKVLQPRDFDRSRLQPIRQTAIG